MTQWERRAPRERARYVGQVGSSGNCLELDTRGQIVHGRYRSIEFRSVLVFFFFFLFFFFFGIRLRILIRRRETAR